MFLEYAVVAFTTTYNFMSVGSGCWSQLGYSYRIALGSAYRITHGFLYRALPSLPIEPLSEQQRKPALLANQIPLGSDYWSKLKAHMFQGLDPIGTKSWIPWALKLRISHELQNLDPMGPKACIPLAPKLASHGPQSLHPMGPKACIPWAPNLGSHRPQSV